MNYRRAFVPNGYLHIIITSYDRKPIFIENIDILRTAFKNTKTITFFQDICSEAVHVTASGNVAVQPILAILCGRKCVD